MCLTTERLRFLFNRPVYFVYSNWSLGRSGSIVRRMNEVTLRLARLVLGWVTVFGRIYRLGM